MKRVEKTSVFPASRGEVFRHLQRLSTLQEIAWPYATFTPVYTRDSAPGASDHAVLSWDEGGTYAFRFRLFGCIPFGTHRIHVMRFREDGILTHEGNENVPVWLHQICMEPLSYGRCLFTDRVTIDAGCKTVFVWIWACAIYAHRQRKWVRIL